MDKDFYTNDFEQLLRERTEEFKMYPSESVWSNIFNKLHPGRRWGIIGGSMLLLLFTASVLILRTNNKDTAGTHQNANRDELSSKDKKSTAFNKSPEVDLNAAESKLVTLNSSSANRNEVFPVTIPYSKTNAVIPADGERNTGSTSFTVKEDINNTFFTNTITGQSPVLTDINLSKATNDNLVFDAPMFDITKAVSGVEKSPSIKPSFAYVNPDNFSGKTTKQAAKKHSPFEWQLYFAPSVSYRALYNNDNAAALAYAYTNYIPGDIDKAVHHTPALGFEFGNAILYSLTKSIKLKTGIQFNYSRYNIKAYSSSPEIATVKLRGDYNQTQELRLASNYKNYGIFYQSTTIASQNVAISVPLGVDLKMMGNKNISWYVSGSFQPTYILNNKAYLITNDLKNYVQNSELFRRFTMNSDVETYLRIEKSNGVALQIGPQIRYQINSSYTRKYPISEHLIEYGLKVGVTKKF